MLEIDLERGGNPLHAQYGLELRQTFVIPDFAVVAPEDAARVANRHEVFEVFEAFARLRRAGDSQTFWLCVRSVMLARPSGAVL